MAGIAKPNVENLGSEMTDYKIIEYNITTGSPQGLFSQTIDENEWDTRNVCYWNGGTSTYTTFYFGKPCNVWRYGNGWYYRKALFKIYDENNIDITSKIKQHTIGTIRGWEKAIEIPKAGIYKFVSANGLRLDSEWYLETVTIESQTIKKAVKEAIVKNKLVQKYCILCEANVE